MQTKQITGRQYRKSTNQPDQLTFLMKLDSFPVNGNKLQSDCHWTDEYKEAQMET